MNPSLDQSVALASAWAGSWSAYALSMFWQTAMVVAVVWFLDRLLRRRSATFRHALWMLVLVRLMLPPDLSFPTGLGTWAAPLLNKVRVSVAPAQTIQPTLAQAAMLSGSPRWTYSPAAAATLAEGIAANPVYAPPRFAPAQPALRIHWTDKISLPVVCFIVWLAGALTLAGLTAIRHFRLRRHLAQAAPIDDQEIYEVFVKCRARIGLSPRHRIQLFSSSEISGPMVTGALRTRLMLPDLLLQVCSREELEGLILHELAHVKRRDLMINWLQIAIQIVHWFNPLVWYVNFRIKQLREEACDDHVVAIATDSTRSYAAGLIKVLEFATPGDPVYSGHAGALEKESFIARRLSRIMDRERKVHAHLTLLRALALVALGAVILPMMPPSDSSATSLSDKALQAERDALLADLGALQSRHMDFCLTLDGEEPTVQGCAVNQRFSKDIFFDPNGIINLNLESENVSISGWDEPKLRIVMTKTVQADGHAENRKEPRDNLRRIRYSLSRMKNMVNLEGRVPENRDGLKYAVHYEIVAPRSTLLNVSTNSGTIQARELQAMLNLRTESGRIRLTSIDGIVNAEAGGCGGIDARQIAGNMTLRSMAGTVAVEEAEGNILLRNDEGSIEARSLVGNAKMFTADGAISLEDISGDIYAQTNDGEMRISNVVGKFTARTDDGNIQIARRDGVLADEKIAVFSNGGNIRLNIPPGSSASFKVDAAKGIESEFAANSGGNERQIAGTIGNGGGEITLKSTEGAISLLKL